MRMTTMVLGVLVSTFSVAAPASVAGQETGEVPSASDDEWTSFAKAYLEISDISAEFQAELALPENKSEDAQTRARESTRRRIHAVLEENGLSEPRYNQLNFLIGTDDERRDAFTQLLEALSARDEGAAGG